MIQIWKCKSCGKINYSIPERHHQLDLCPNCKNEWVDLETYGCRSTLGVEFIEKLDYNFFIELIYCMDEQEFEPFLNIDRVYIEGWAVMKAREIEDEIISNFINDKYSNSL